MKHLISLLFLTSSLVLMAYANTKYIKILPSDAKVKPRARTPLPADYIKKYWISGTFFNKENFQGLPMSFYFSGSKCINFPQHKSLSSLKPIGCVMLYNSKDCKGTYAVVSEEMANLNEIGMHDAIGSMKSCPPVDDSWKPRQNVETPSSSNHQNVIMRAIVTSSSSPKSVISTSTENSIKIVKV